MLLGSNNYKILLPSTSAEWSVPSGKSRRIVGLSALAYSSATTLTLRIDRVTVASYRIGGKSGNQISPLVGGQLHYNLFSYLLDNGIDVTLPLAEGQTLTVEVDTGNAAVIIQYDEFTAGDVQSSAVNGSDSNSYVYVNYLDTSTTPTNSGDVILDVSKSPAEFPAFPAGQVVPANTAISLLGVVGSPWCDGASGPVYFSTNYLKFMKGRDVLFSEDRQGLPFSADTDPGTGLEYNSKYSVVGPCVNVPLDSATVGTGNPLLFNPALEFNSGDELNVYVNVTKSGAATWTAGVPDVGVILQARRLV